MRHFHHALEVLHHVFRPDDTVLGGGNSKYIEPVPKGCRRKDNQGAFRGAVRMWPGADMLAEAYGTSYRIKKNAKSDFPPAAPASKESGKKRNKKSGKS